MSAPSLAEARADARPSRLGSFAEPAPGVTTLLFDLDGTLVEMRERGAELRFILRAALRFSRQIRPWRFRRVFWSAVEAMRRNASDRTNYEVMIDSMAAAAGCSPAAIDALIEGCMREDFGALARHFRPIAGARQTLVLARDLGYRIVIATNPVFPRTGVTMRLEWGGLGDLPFEFISHSQVMTRAKPQRAYYEELLRRLDLRPEECAMIGNDSEKDLPATEIGVPTFLLDFSDRGTRRFLSDPRLDGWGSFEELRELAQAISGRVVSREDGLQGVNMQHKREPLAGDEEEERPRQEENVENFSLGDFFRMGWDTIDAKTALFAPYFEGVKNAGLIMREVRGAAGARMPVGSRDVLMFGSNNYLGFANEPFVVERVIEAVRKYGVGCGGPPLLNGYTELHRELEERLAAFKHCQGAIVFSSGYAANVGWTTGLLTPNDVLIYDIQSHASLYDGIKMGRFESIHFDHNDLDHLRKRLMQARWKNAHGNIVVCVEGVYSMDGDIAPLPEIRRLCTKYDARLAIDDAHGTGVLGKAGGGTAEHFGMEGQVDIVMGTFSKIFAVTGGFIAGPKPMVDYLRFFARSYMFSASLPPPVVASVLAGLDFLRDHPERVRALHDNVSYFVSGLRRVGFDVAVETAIVPIHVPEHVPMRSVVGRLQEEGIFVNGIEYPAVPRDRQRLRLSVMATFTRSDLDHAVETLGRVGRELGFLPGEAR